MKTRTSTGMALRAAALALLFAASAPGYAATDAKASRFYEDALVRYEKKDVAGAIIQLKNALQIDKTMLPVHVLLGKALLANSDVIGAEVAFTEALRLGVNRAEVVVPLARSVVAQGKLKDVIDQPRFAPAGLPNGVQAQLLLVRAGARADLGNAREALNDVEQARALDPASAGSWLSEVPIRIRARQFPEAVAAAEKALGLAPSSADAEYLRGTISHAQGHLSAALSSYDRALKLAPEHTEALVSRAGLLIDLDRRSDAARDIATLRRLHPQEPRGAYLSALLAERNGDPTTAKAALKDITALVDPVPMEFMRYRPQLLMLGGLAHHGLGQNEKAKPYLEAVQRQYPASPVAKLLAQIYLAEGNNDRAVDSLESYLRSAPTDAQAVSLLASAHMAQGRHAQATRLLQRTLELTDSPRLQTTLGLSLMESGKPGDAITQLEAAYKKDPALDHAAAALVTLYLQAGQPKKAVSTAEALVKRKPANPGFQNLLGIARAKAGDIGGAKAAFERAMQIDPKFVEPQLNLARVEVVGRDYPAAVKRLDLILQADDKQVEALTERGLLAARMGQPAEATRWLQKAVDHSRADDLRPNLKLVEHHLSGGRVSAAQEAVKGLAAKAPEALPVIFAQARVSLAAQQPDDARRLLVRASNIAQYDAPLLVRIAMLQLAVPDPKGASYSLSKALQGAPAYLPALALQVDADVAMGEYVAAERRARSIADAYPQLGVGHSLVGDVAMARGQTAAATAAYQRAFQVEPNSDRALRLFRALMATDPPAAQRLADDWLRREPRDIAMRRAHADSQARAGRFDAARAGYEAILGVAPDDAEAMNNLAHLLILKGDPRALQMAEQALARKPEAAHIIGTAGWAAFKAGQTDRALQLLRDARLRDPANDDTRYFLAEVLVKAGRRDEARSELQASLQGGRTFPRRDEAKRLFDTLN